MNELDPPSAGTVASCRVVTVAGRSFCCSDVAGDIDGAGPEGYFVLDTRFISKLAFQMNGRRLESVSEPSTAPDRATFFLRDGASGPRLRIRRERRHGSGLADSLEIQNISERRQEFDLSVLVATDFAHVLDVRLQDAELPRPVSTIPTERGLRFTYAGAHGRYETEIEADRPVGVADGVLSWKARLQPGARWSVTLRITPRIDERRLESPPKRTARAWPSVATTIDPLRRLWKRAQGDLRLLEILVDDCWTYAAGVPWFQTVFGRDSILTALEVLLVDRDIGLSTAELLASLQGKEVRPATSEEPGKILHELREGERGLSEARCYYGSVDSTPLFCILLGELDRWGAEASRLAALLPALRAAARWIEHGLDSGDGFLTYGDGGSRLGHEGWKDHAGSIVDGEGRLLEPPIAVVEAQGYAVAGLKAAARLEARFGDPVAAERLAHAARLLTERIDTHFWMPDLGTYAMALGRAGHIADTISSNPGHLLWAGVVPAERAHRVAATLIGPELWSGWGVRCLARSNPAFDPGSYHRGSVWPHDTALAAAGMARYGLAHEAQTLIGGLLDAAPHFGYRLPEVFSGRDRQGFEPPVRLAVSNSLQAWSAGVPVLLVEAMLGIDPDVPAGASGARSVVPGTEVLAISDVALAGGSMTVRARGSEIELVEIRSDLGPG